MGLTYRFLGSAWHDVGVCHGKPLRHTRFCDENRQNNPVHGVSEAQMSGSPPSGWQNTRYFYPILLF